jgi:hypothetical protein
LRTRRVLALRAPLPRTTVWDLLFRYTCAGRNDNLEAEKRWCSVDRVLILVYSGYFPSTLFVAALV